MADVYQRQPTLASEAITLRPLREEDAKELLRVYGDERAVPCFNGDNCHGDTFYYPTLKRMREALDFWRFSYEHGYFVRWSIVENATAQVIGTVELFDRESGAEMDAVLRLDLRWDREREETIVAVLETLLPRVLEGFRSRTVVTKCWPHATQRRQALEWFGFAPDSRAFIGNDGTVYGDYWRIDFTRELGRESEG